MKNLRWMAWVPLLATGCAVPLQGAEDDPSAEHRLGTGPADLTVADLVEGDLVITEIMQNPAAVYDRDGEWFEVLNTTGLSVDLGGLILSDLDRDETEVLGNPVLLAGDRAVFGRNLDPLVNGGVDVDLPFSGMWLANGSDELILSHGTTEIDAVMWDNGATFPDESGRSMALSDEALDDNHLGESWCIAQTPYGDGDLGTPGGANDCPGAPQPWFRDADGDGYGDPTDTITATAPPSGYVLDGTDCDDSDDAVHPGAVEQWGNTVDEDCDTYLRKTFPCSGNDVPGDYATIQAAADAIIAGNAGSHWICLGENVHTEDLDIHISRSIYMYIAGVNADVSVLRGNIEVTGDASLVTGLQLWNLTVDGGIDSYNPMLYVQDSVITGGGPRGSGIYGSSLDSIYVVRSDVSSPTHDALHLFGAPAGTTRVVVMDSYLHDSTTGLRFWAAGSTIDVSLINNTIANNDVGILGEALWPYSSFTHLDLNDNVIVGSGVGIELDQGAGHNDNNALFGNTTHYAGAGGAGTNTITADPLLDWSVTPPMPDVGSPLIDAGSPEAREWDHWNETRTLPDVGAVERPL